MGHPAYEITSGSVTFLGKPLDDYEVHERARWYVSFIPVSTFHPRSSSRKFLKKSVSSIRNEQLKARDFRKELNAAMSQLEMDKSFLSRYVNDGFSGGEKKRLETLQMLFLNHD